MGRDYVAKVDAKRIKKMYRTMKNGLAWQWPKSVFQDLVSYVESKINIWPTMALSENLRPR